ncbi:dihydropteroate synthase [uncultured Acetatifactor sp.]|uniref:dihydropteroate synthase n=1 Tax=uncultured Acetatifactor sp. TaxID=1671927 RepID=UPI00260FA017|nr:dihydropteroate synthase [uncultured Acetatifactor sp.]
MKIGNREFQTKGHTYVMGILNVTPDSFSDGGKWNDRDRALRHVEEMLEEGADIIDIGGESTRPGYTLLPEHEEIERVVPVIEAVKAAFDVPVSLDTYKARVASAGIAAGADLINDVWGLKYDGWSRNGADAPDNGGSGQGGSTMAQVIAESGLPCCLMHNRRDTDYQDFVHDVIGDLEGTLRLAEQAGIGRERIILDPGVGFAKSYEQNLEIIRRMGELGTLGCPLLLGCSRKSVIGLTLDLSADQRLEGTLVTTVAGVLQGAMFVRVHDVRENVRAVRMAEAIFAERVSGG